MLDNNVVCDDVCAVVCVDVYDAACDNVVMVCMVVKVLVRWNDWFYAVLGFWFMTNEQTNERMNGHLYF